MHCFCVHDQIDRKLFFDLGNRLWQNPPNCQYFVSHQKRRPLHPSVKPIRAIHWNLPGQTRQDEGLQTPEIISVCVVRLAKSLIFRGNPVSIKLSRSFWESMTCSMINFESICNEFPSVKLTFFRSRRKHLFWFFICQFFKRSPIQFNLRLNDLRLQIKFTNAGFPI